MSKPIVTASQVRAFYNAKPARLASLKVADRATVEYDSEGHAPKGRLAPGVIVNHNARRTVQYVLGASESARQAQGAQAASLRAQAAAAGVQVGKRGPLPKAFLASLKG